MSPILAARRALERLRTGNQRFVAGRRLDKSVADLGLRADLAAAQAPFAIILGCSDSRVPAELVFDQGLGDLFVIRVAGNVVAPSQIGSVEFAAEAFGTRLAVVMGHSGCGAVKATIDEIQGRTRHESGNLRSIIDRVRPAVDPLLETAGSLHPERLLAAAVRANVHLSVDRLCHGSEVIEQRVGSGELLVVGAEYSLETGAVEFFD
jgi:carbonic anhydrase